MHSRPKILPGLRSLWRIRFLTALVISLPLLFLGVWYGWRAWASHVAYRDAAGESISLTAEVIHLHLHDRLCRDLRRLTMPSVPDRPPLPVYSLVLRRSDLQTLTSDLAGDSPRPYVPVLIAENGRFLSGEVRIRGGRHWHWAHPQKSMKIVLDVGNYLNGVNVFNLMNEVAPISVGEGVILDILRDLGVLTPTNRLCRVMINKRPMGVHLFISQINESLLRKNKRMYGSLYSGNQAPVDPETNLSTLWSDPKPWKKVASWKPEEIKDERELEKLLEMVNEATVLRFEGFARDRMDLEKFAAFDAVDAVFGGNQHDWNENHKLYFDPYRGRFEPVAWNFRGWRHEPAFLTVENPLRLRLAWVPGYLSRRNRIVYELLRGPCSVTELRRRLLKKIRRASPEFACDPYWDAYKLLPPVNRALRRMVRPMNEERQALVLESEVKTFSTRHAFLLKLLEHNEISVRLGPGREGAAPLDIVVDGFGAYRLDRIRVGFPPGQRSPAWQFRRDSDLDGLFHAARDRVVPATSSGKSAVFSEPDLLEPAARMVPRRRPTPHQGRVALEPAPRRYRYFVVAKESPSEVELEFLNTVTGWRVTRRARAGDDLPEPDGLTPPGAPDAIPPFEPGETNVHPWFFPRPHLEPVRLGPGVVTFRETRVFQEAEPVTIERGTVLRLGAGASLIFRGKLLALGTREEEIVIERADPEAPFGGVALQGSGTSGSVLEFVRIAGGSSPAWGMARFPGMVNIHDTRDVLLRAVRLEGNRDSDDALHVAYCRKITLESCSFENVNADALDLEFSEATIKACRFSAPPDECIDMMNSRADVADCVFLRARTNAVSAGEKSRVRILGSLIAGSRTGILVKSRSEAALGGTLFFGNKTAVRLITRSPKYGGRSKVSGDILYAVDCSLPVFVDDRSSPDIARVVRRFPRDGSLDHLLRDVLELDDWRFLPAMLEKAGVGERGDGK